MSFAPTSAYNENIVAGGFREKEYDNFFEFTKICETPFVGFNRKIYVGNNGETRFAKVLKTVVHVVVDEDENGLPIVEKWFIKDYRDYKKGV